MAFSYKYLILTVLSCSFAIVCLSSTFAHENHISLATDGIIDEDSDPSFPSIQVKVIYQFGDSISDTGNKIRSDLNNMCSRWPYGKTFFNKPTGRCSDGLLMIDYFAKFLNLPFLDAYLNKDGNFTHGVDFAVNGATALAASTLKRKYNVSSSANLSLEVQLGWFKSHLNSFHGEVSERKTELSKGLFIMGEVGGNDYNHAFEQGKTLPYVYKMVPAVVQVIRSVVEEIIQLGATHIVVPGNFPIGCIPDYLERFKASDSNMYDELKCLKPYNDLAKFHNDLLQQTILELQMDHPIASIVYIDYYGTLKEILQHAALLGFDENAIHGRCCGSPGTDCGTGEKVVCEKPQEYISWDGIHFTQHVYHIMAKRLIRSVLLAFQNVEYDEKAIA